jgi:alpha-glucosidase
MLLDFIERDDQDGIDWYYRVADLAAHHHLMVDYHGATKPTGMERTYPNVLGYEAVAGMEQSKAGSRDNPDHHFNPSLYPHACRTDGLHSRRLR